MTHGNVKMTKKMRTPNAEMESMQYSGKKVKANNPRSMATLTTVSS